MLDFASATTVKGYLRVWKKNIKQYSYWPTSSHDLFLSEIGG